VTIIGAGGHAKVVIATLRDAGHGVSACYDDDPRLTGAMISGVKVRGRIDTLTPSSVGPCFIAVGNNQRRQAVATRMHGADFVRAVHPDAVVHESVSLGPGTLVCAGAVIQPDCILGSHVIINTRSSVDHDCMIDDFAHVAPGSCLAGGVAVGAGTLIGIGASVIPQIRIGEWATVGAGAAVIKDVAAHDTVVGVPAATIRARTQQP